MNGKERFSLSIPVSLLLIIILIAADQVTKILSVTHLKGQADISLIPGVLELHYLENHGAAFGILQNSRAFFIVIAVCAILGITFLYLRIPEHRTAEGKSYLPLRICALLLISGAAGNLIDRIRLVYVRDFIYFSLINFPVFNFADIVLVIGWVWLAIAVFKDLKYKK